MMDNVGFSGGKKIFISLYFFISVVRDFVICSELIRKIEKGKKMFISATITWCFTVLQLSDFYI